MRPRTVSRTAHLAVQPLPLAAGAQLLLPAEPPDVARLARPIALLADGATEPPKELRLFSAGVIETTKGLFKFDEGSAESVLKCWKDLGRDYPFDYEHASLFAIFAVDPAEAGKAAGWFQLEIRNGECWAVNCQWTPKAREKILAREFRYTSPTFRHSEEGQVLEVHSCALTNDPATKRAQPVLNNRAAAAPGREEEVPMLKLLAARLGLSDSATEAEVIAALSRLQDDQKVARDGLTAVLALSGKPTAAEALGVFTAWKAGAEQVSGLSAKVVELERAATQRELDALIAQGTKDGKIPPALEAWARGQGVESLKAFLSAAVPMVVTPDGGTKAPDDKGGTVASLSDDQKKIAATLGVKAEDVAKTAAQAGR